MKDVEVDGEPSSTRAEEYERDGAVGEEPWEVEANSEGWALGEIAACDGLGAERVESMAKVKLRGSRATRRAKVQPYTRSVTPSKIIARTI